MEMQLLWGVLLLAGALALIALEVFVPSAGIISLVALGLAGSGVYVLWQHDPMWGVGGLLATLVLAPMVFFGTLNIWKTTKLGRRALGVPDDEEVERRKLAEEAAARDRLAMLGEEGTVLSDMRPVGAVEISGRRYDALAEGGFINAGTRVRVVGVTGQELRVRAL